MLELYKTKNIRNFAIISHIDHGKSTLADRFLEITKTVEKKKMKAQMLDQMDLEREKGITIKLQPVRMIWHLPNHSEITNSKFQIPNKSQIPNSKIQNGLKISDSRFILNLIDTPGHVDFTYEVSRSLSAVEGAILLVDATQGIQAQTIFNLDMALNENLKIIPVVNKIDLPNAQIDKAVEDAANLLAEDISQVEKISAKTGQGVEKIIERIIKDVPPPKDNSQKPLRTLIFDSFFDSYKGVIAYIRIVDGFLEKGDKILFMATGEQGEVLDLGVFVPEMKPKNKLFAGEIGWVATGIKEIEKCRVGDTIIKSQIPNPKSQKNYKIQNPKLETDNQKKDFNKQSKSELKPLPGYQEPKPMVYASFYLAEEKNFNVLATALKKLKLNDAALTYQGESSNALGQGFRLGFLGLLHLEIISERLKREYNLDLIITSPSVSYKVNLKNQETISIYSPSDLPDRSKILTVEEPWVKLDIICPKSYLGNVMELLKNCDGDWKDTQYINSERIILKYEAPLSMIIVDFYDQLKSVSSGFASMSYILIGFRVSDLVKLNILIAGENAEAFSKIVSRKRAYQEGKNILLQLKKSLPRQNFVIALQAALEEKIIARENISAFRKDVTAGLYGGDYSRKRKLLEKQKKGKKKMKRMGKIDIPTETFLAVLRKR
jgi:GTP-binding protein LepA